jgi:hypothetical protein
MRALFVSGIVCYTVHSLIRLKRKSNLCRTERRGYNASTARLAPVVTSRHDAAVETAVWTSDFDRLVGKSGDQRHKYQLVWPIFRTTFIVCLLYSVVSSGIFSYAFVHCCLTFLSFHAAQLLRFTVCNCSSRSFRYYKTVPSMLRTYGSSDLLLGFSLQYFGSVDGLLRYFPSVTWQNKLSGFDHRARPWYRSAIMTSSTPSNVVLVIDSSMMQKTAR